MSVPGYLIIDGSADVHLGDALGEGGFSQVHKGTALTSELRARAGGEEMAIKLMKGEFRRFYLLFLLNVE